MTIDEQIAADLASIPVANLALANKAAAKIIADTANTLGTSPGIFLMQRQALAVIATQTDLIYLQQP